MNHRAYLPADHEDIAERLRRANAALAEALVQLMAEVSNDGQPGKGLDPLFHTPSGSMQFAYHHARNVLKDNEGL